MASESLNVIALISGGKDSFYSILHCLQNGHIVVALANLYPARSESAATTSGNENGGSGTTIIRPESPVGGLETRDGADIGMGQDDQEEDLNSFMYQTVGHQIIPLYATATNLPLYRQPIHGGAKDSARDYDAHSAVAGAGVDETESMVPLLKTIMARHPEANALCAGAILSSYQRTRVESVALRLKLTPLAYLWKYPILPAPASSGKSDDAQLLHDMAAAGLDARIVKVASAGLDESFLWERVSSAAGAERLKRGLQRFGAGGDGAVLGEGGEFETIVLDGPPVLFSKRIVVVDAGKRVVREGGGTSWLSFQGASVEDKLEADIEGNRGGLQIRVPEMLDRRFHSVLHGLDQADGPATNDALSATHEFDPKTVSQYVGVRSQTPPRVCHSVLSATMLASGNSPTSSHVEAEPAAPRSIEEETNLIKHQLVRFLEDPMWPQNLPSTTITNTIVVLRRMSDFPAVNNVYGTIFSHPNPPSRVTISCGDLLPEGCNILMHIALRPGVASSDRNGLHVQSRSYWAPANIGPYSQAISVPLHGGMISSTSARESGATEEGPRLTSIAGQIPLVPATMVLPLASSTGLHTQIILSLQHLWRIGTEMHVQFWTSVVAYFPRAESAADMPHRARLAAKAWANVHLHSEEDGSDLEDEGPDLWDRKFNPQFMSFRSGDNAQGAQTPLPDWEVVASQQAQRREDQVSPFFAVEVEELPRQAEVEWHAHIGLSQLDPSTVNVTSCSVTSAPEHRFRSRVTHVTVSTANSLYTHSILSIEAQEPGVPAQRLEDITDQIILAYQVSLGSNNEETQQMFMPHLIYADATQFSSPLPWRIMTGSRDCATIIPCRSVWSGTGTKLAAVAVFTYQVESQE